jgi:hypothetical protein
LKKFLVITKQNSSQSYLQLLNPIYIPNTYLAITYFNGILHSSLGLSSDILTLSVVAERVTLPLRIQDVPVSNIGPETGHPH